MDTLFIELSAALIDNPATPDHRTKVEITLENASDSLEIENQERSPRSVHKFTLKDPHYLGYGSAYNLTIEQAALILALSCSLANHRILFTPLQPNLLASSIKYEEIPPKIEVVDAPGKKSITITEKIGLVESFSTVLGTKLSLDESLLLNVANRLLVYRIFDTSNRDLKDLNVLEAIKRYRDALMAAEGISCYSFLYSAFEKAINADKGRKKKDFDKAASAVTGLSENDLEDLRLFNNRIKHALRNHADFATLRAGESRLAALSRNLKKATDKAILYRI